MNAGTLDAEDVGGLGDVLIAAVRVGAVVSWASLSKTCVSVKVADRDQRAMLAWDLDCTRRVDETAVESFRHPTGDTVIWGPS